METTRMIYTDLLEPDPDQPRKNKPIEYLRDELAMSIAHRGLRNAIHVRPHPGADGKFMIVNGECRFLAVSMFVKAHVQKMQTPPRCAGLEDRCGRTHADRGQNPGIRRREKIRG